MDTPDRAIFDDIYGGAQPQQIAWHYDEAPAQLLALIDSGVLQPCRALDLGCGLGSQCLALARRGFEVTGLDCSGVAIEAAKQRAAQASVEATFVVADVLGALDGLRPPYDLVWDWEVLHHIFPPQRPQHIEKVASLLEPGGRYLSVAFSEENPWLAEQGKYRTTPIGTVLYFSSERELQTLFEPAFRLVELKTIEIRGKRAPHRAIWVFGERR